VAYERLTEARFDDWYRPGRGRAAAPAVIPIRGVVLHADAERLQLD